MPNIASPARTDCPWPLLATAAGCLLALAVALFAVVAVPWPLSESGLASTQVAHYNRWGWALLTTLLLFGVELGCFRRTGTWGLAAFLIGGLEVAENGFDKDTPASAKYPISAGARAVMSSGRTRHG